MEGVKPAAQSTGMWGGFTALLSGLMIVLGADGPTDFNTYTGIVTMFGALFALYGRYTAIRQISGMFKPKE